MAAEVEASTSKASGRRGLRSSRASAMLSSALQAKKLQKEKKDLPRNRDLPTKEEVDRDQEEQESLTWADRYGEED